MENPFSTKFWSPGAIPFQFSESGETVEMLRETAERCPICQIVGPHGSGKSTLLLNLLKWYETNGEPVRLLLFNDKQRSLPYDLMFPVKQILFADGFEQLSWKNRLQLLLRAKRLILTAHRPVWCVPVLYRTKPQFSVFVQIVRQMMPAPPEESVLRKVYERSGGHFRNAFFELYDQWEETIRR
jgi:GTPase SAR1 family protein